MGSDTWKLDRSLPDNSSTGSGYVKEVGPGVTVAQPGDPILLSFAFCNSCSVCKSGHHSHCLTFNELNFGKSPQTAIFGTKGETNNVQGAFFGQSSFASYSIVRQCSVVNAKGLVNDKKELQLFAPLGCGIQTGSGTVINAAKAGPDDIICIIGLGGVGLSAVMGAKVAGCKSIVGIDRVASRLQIAQELGCTAVVDGSNLPAGRTLVEAVRDATEGLGPHITVDTTGVPTLIKSAIEWARNTGKVVQVGSAPFDFKLDIEVFNYMVRGIQYIGAIEGQAYPPEFVPKMIKWYREGRFPVDKLMKLMPAEQFQQALKEMHDGETIKPILTWS